MADLALVNKEIDDLLAEREVIRAKHPGAFMPEEARKRDEEIADRVARLKVVALEEQQNARDKMFEEANEFLNKPQNQISHPVNADDEGRRTMMRAGWKIQDGMIMRETAFGDIVFCQEEAMFGPLPSDDPVAAQTIKELRVSFQPDYRNVYKKWLALAIKVGDGVVARSGLTTQEQNALSEGTLEGGGAVVPADTAAALLVRLQSRSVMNRICRVVPTSRDRWEAPAVKKAASNGTIYSSGFVGGVVGETPAFANNDAQFEMFEIGIKKFRSTTLASNDWLADASVDMLGFLARDGGGNLALTEDYYFINGLGTGLQPRGLLESGLSTTTVEGTTTDHISNTVSNAGSAPLIDQLPYAVPSQYAENGQWLFARSTEGKIRGLVDANGRSWWMPQQVAGGQGSTPRELGGYPVNNSEWMPVGGTNGNKVIVFGDFQEYIIARRANIATRVLTERFADTEQTGVMLVSRAGGGLWNTDAFIVGIV